MIYEDVTITKGTGGQWRITENTHRLSLVRLASQEDISAGLIGPRAFTPFSQSRALWLCVDITQIAKK